MNWGIIAGATTILVFLGLIIWYISYSIITTSYQGIRPDDRTQADLEHFINYWLEKGYEESTIKSLIKVTRILTYKGFIPIVTDDFTKDYKWHKVRGDQFETKIMECAGLTLADLMSGKVTDKNWREYQEEFGRINGFESLLYYIHLRYIEGPKYPFKPNKLVW